MSNRPKRIQKGLANKEELTRSAIVSADNVRPVLHAYFGNVVADKHEAERLTKLAALKIFEFIVSGQVPHLPGEDYYVTACRLIGQGLKDIKASPNTKRALAKLFKNLRPDKRWTTTAADVVEMRKWRGKRAPTRAILLLTLLQGIIGPAELAKWLESSNPNLADEAPIDLLQKTKWTLLADFIDDMMTGSPT